MVIVGLDPPPGGCVVGDCVVGDCVVGDCVVGVPEHDITTDLLVKKAVSVVYLTVT